MSSESEPIVASALAIAQVYALDADAGHALAPPPGYRFADITWKGAGESGRLRTFGAGFEGDDALLLAFRGTADVSDLFADLRCEEAPFDGLFPSDPTPRFRVPLRGAAGGEADRWCGGGGARGRGGGGGGCMFDARPRRFDDDAVVALLERDRIVGRARVLSVHEDQTVQPLRDFGEAKRRPLA